MTNLHGLTKEFYETFWNELKEIFTDSVSETKEKLHLSTSKTGYHQVNRKKIKIRDSYKTGDLFFLLNVDLKIILKALSEKLKKILPYLISTQQTAYVKNRHIAESGRSISDTIKLLN